ncbi:hypothetical protein [Geothermobacter hydrogeniphilus]|uniref:hypothetical protein n=1 Tax=Geothermobacter hydrogeniphilus TaxID=1969733 RepID=UPI00111C0823|nr:hypothetical protein [Geothermobacter hydrogeniphilus]
MKRPRKGLLAKQQEELPYSDEHFAYIAGYTEGGFPYGITWEEMREIEAAEKKSAGVQSSKESTEAPPDDIDDIF